MYRTAAGTIPAPNIQRQFAGPELTIAQPVQYAARIPVTIPI
jgi:hypothetical protein